MFVAVDKLGNRIYAETTGERYTECYCQVCGEPVTHKLGKIKRAHFSHKPNSDCYYGYDKDYKTEWHIRMQKYFPKETREFRFEDKETGEVHIADVFLKDLNTVLEFQHSTIDEKEFVSRTNFHLKNGRRIAWIFDESVGNPNNPNYGKLKRDEYRWEQWPYDDRCFKWLYNPRAFLRNLTWSQDFTNRLSICVYTGTEGEIIHRIVGQHSGFEFITLSLHTIEIKEGMNVEDFFQPESYWQNQEPWKSEIEKRKAYAAYKQRLDYIERQKQIAEYFKRKNARKRLRL